VRHQDPFQGVPKLTTEIRPELDHLTTELLTALAEEWPQLHTLRSTEWDSLFRQSELVPAIHLALLPLIDGSLQSQGVNRAKRVH
jgi:hypothetical protein